MGKILIKTFFIINMVLTLAFSALWMKSIKHELKQQTPTQSNAALKDYLWIVDQFKTYNREFLGINDYSYERIIALLAIFLFIHFIIKSVLQFLQESFGFKLKNITKCFKNIVQSTILYSFILGFVLTAMLITNYQASLITQKSILINNSTSTTVDPTLGNQTVQNMKYSNQLIFIILETYLYGRILFSIGYIFGTILQLESFRAYGLGLVFGSIVVAFSYVYDLNLWNYF